MAVVNVSVNTPSRLSSSDAAEGQSDHQQQRPDDSTRQDDREEPGKIGAANWCLRDDPGRLPRRQSVLLL